MSQPTKLAIYRTTRSVIKADAACRNAGIAVRVIAVPPNISSDCGMCLQITDSRLDEFNSLMQSLSIETKIYDYTFI